MNAVGENAKDPVLERVPVPPLEVSKGILHAREQARHRTLTRVAAGPEMSRFVEWYWEVRWDLRDSPPFAAEVLPFPSVNLSFERTAAGTGGFVNGVCTTKYSRELAGEGEAFAVKFRPGGFGAFTGLDVAAFRDAVIDVAEVLPQAQGLTERVLGEPATERRRDVVEDFFAERARTAVVDDNYRLLLRMIATMESDCDLLRVDQVAERFDVPIRTLQRLFRRYVGATPKWVLRRYRLQDGAQLLADGYTEDLAALALDLGYFDQAHFSREFALEVGMTPLEYARSAD